ncbi:MAG TPA: glycosyltransferase family 4 protein [Candidatus Binatia bacterium]|nr:glycosyltransferase family 4 protein [Candidatus Binatia bacterium]
MKIGLVCPYDMIMHAGGVQECVSALQRELSKRGHKVVVITPQPQGYDGKAPSGMVFVGKSKRIKTLQHTSADVAISVDPKSIDRLISEEQFDIVHIHEPLVPFLPRQLLPRLTCPVVGTFHATSPETMLAKTLAGSLGLYVKSILKRLDVLTAVSPAATSYIDSYQHRPVTYIANGVNLDVYKPPPKPIASPHKTIVYIGRLEARKGVKYLLKAYALVAKQHPDVRLLIAGEGVDKLKLEKYVESHDLPHVKFLGFISQAEKVSLLQRSDLFCAPALYGESFGIVLLEAMACGLPIVAGNNPGYASVLKEDGQQSLVDPKDIQTFSYLLELMLYDENLRKAWRAWALKEVKAYAYPKIVDQYEAVYKQAMGTIRL